MATSLARNFLGLGFTNPCQKAGKTLLLTYFLASLPLATFGQGLVSMGNNPTTRFSTNSLATNGTSGPALSANGPWYYEVLTAPSTVSSVDASLQELLSSPWSDTGLQGTNTGLAGRESSGNNVVSNWPAGWTNIFLVVGWSANQGATWASVTNRLAGAQLVPQNGGFGWVGGALVPGGFVGATTLGFRIAGGVVGGSTVPTPFLFGTSADSQGTPITTPTSLWLVTGPGNSSTISIIIQPTDRTVQEGSNSAMSVLAVGAPIIYQWQFNGVDVPGATNNPYTVTNAQLSQSGNYSVVLTNDYGSVTSQLAVLQVLPYGAPSIRVNGRLAAGMASAVGSAQVTISGGFTNGFVFYTLDGSTPTTSSPLYSGAITVTNSATIQAMSLSGDFSQTAYAPAVSLQIIPVYELQTSVVGSGSIAVNPTNGSYASNTLVTVTANPSLGWSFDHWTGDLSGGQNPASLVMNGPRNVQAAFTQTAYPLTVSTPGGGSVTANGQLIAPATFYPAGSVVTLAASASNGWSFMGWQGDASGTNNPLNVTMNQTNNIQAIFGTVVATNTSGGGRIVLNLPNPIPYGTLLTASAVPDPGKYLVTWSGAATGTNAPTTINVTTANPTVGALFTTLPAGKYSLAVVVMGNGSVAISPQQSYYNPGDAVTLSASATDPGTRFSGWTGDASGTNSPILVTMNTNRIVQANFGSSPTVNISPQNLTVLAGSNAVLTANAAGLPPLSYQWQNSQGAIAGATNATFTIFAAQAADSGSYSVIVSNPFGSVTSSIATVTVVFPPSISIQPLPQVVAAGTTVSLSVLAGGTAPLTYQWQNGAGAIPGKTNSTLVYSPAQTNHTGSYSVIVSNPYGAVTSQVAAVVVYLPVSIQSQPASLVVPASAPASFSVMASGFPLPLTYQWSHSGTNLPDATASAFFISHVHLSDLGDYQVAAGNAYSSANSAIATLSMSPSIIAPFTGATTIWGRSAVLSVGAIGSGDLSYQWYKDGLAIFGATNATLAFASMQFTNGGMYSVVVSSSFGSVSNVAAQVIVNPAGVGLGFSPTLTITGVVGYTYTIQSSTNLTDASAWVTLTNLTLTEPVQIWVDATVDASSPFSSRYFYQVRPGP